MKKSLFLSATALAIAVIGAFAFTAKSVAVNYYLDENGSPVLVANASQLPCDGSSIQCQAQDPNSGIFYNAYLDAAFQQPIKKN